MPLTRYANQKWIKVHKTPVSRDFLQIPNQEWMHVNKELTPYGLQLYLYLASNANGYELALSPQDARDQAGICRTSFYEYLRQLEKHGYLVWRHTNTYDFYTVARPIDERTDPDNHQSMIRFEDDSDSEQFGSNESAIQTFDPFTEQSDPDCELSNSDRDIVIYNKYTADNQIDNLTYNAGETPAPPASAADAASATIGKVVEIHIPDPTPSDRRKPKEKPKRFSFLDDDLFNSIDPETGEYIF